MRGKCDCWDDTGLCPRCFPDETPSREAILREGWAAEAFNAWNAVSQRRWDDADVTEEIKNRYRNYVDRMVEKALK